MKPIAALLPFISLSLWCQPASVRIVRDDVPNYSTSFILSRSTGASPVTIRFSATSASVRLGKGYILDDPDFPVESNRYPFESHQGTTQANPMQWTFDIDKTVTEETEAKNLAVFFSAGFSGLTGGGSASMYRNLARSNKVGSTIFYAYLDCLGDTKEIESRDIKWSDTDESRKPTPSTLTFANDEVQRDWFLQQFGSHYLRKITYGYRVVIRFEAHTQDQQTVNQIGAAISASFSGFSARGTLNSSAFSTLHNYNVSCKGVVVAGGTKPSIPLVFQSPEDVNDFLRRASKPNGDPERIEIITCPINGELWPIRPELQLFPSVSRLLAFDSTSRKATPAEWGVPKGTIIAWSPGPGDLVIENQHRIIRPPEGWALCDGRGGTPNLSDRFILGSNIPESLGSLSGSLATSTQPPVVQTFESGGIKVSGKLQDQFRLKGDDTYGHTHSVVVRLPGHEHSFMPPNAKFAFIIKL